MNQSIKITNVIENIPTILLVLLLLIICVATNIHLVPYGIALHDSDQLIYPLSAEYCRRYGQCMIFPFDQGYGGAMFSWLRAALVPVFELFSKSDTNFITAHMFFSYILTPSLITVFIFFAAKRYCSKTGSFLTGLVAATGMQFCFDVIGIDFYPLLLIFASVFLIARANSLNPFYDFNYKKLLLISILSGFAIYTFRANMIYICAFFVPWHLIPTGVISLFRKTGILTRFFQLLILFLFVFYVFLKLHGKDLGIIFGHRIIIHATPNLHLSLILLFLLWLIHNFQIIIKFDFFKRMLLIIAGFLIGFMPEVIHLVSSHQTIQNWTSSSETQSLESLSILKSAILEIILGSSFRNLYHGFLLYSPLVLFLISMSVLVFSSFKKKRLIPIYIFIVLNVIAFISIFMSTPGGSRYLMPAMPALLLSTGIALDEFKKHTFFYCIMIVLILSTSIYNVVQRNTWLNAAISSGRAVEIPIIVDAAKKLKVPIVITDDYWNGIQYTFYSGDSILFLPKKHPYNPPRAITIANTANRIGVLLAGQLKPDPNGQILIWNRYFKLKHSFSYGKLALYEGTAIK